MSETTLTPSKEIIALSDFEHVLLKPEMYVGSIEPIEESVRIIKNNIIENATKPISIGFYKLMNEILDNAFDEAKRMNGKMTKITISFDSKTKRVTVIDTGNGFFKGTEKNKKTGMNNIETAMTMLRAGSNFKNNEIQNTILGTHGIGASVVNMLSDEFEIHTINNERNYKQVWNKFKSVLVEDNPRKRGDISGTTISFIPRADKYAKCNWDFEYIEAQMIFKEYIRKKDPVLNNVIFEVYCDNLKLDLNKEFVPEDSFIVESKIGQFILWEHCDNGTKMTSFINTALCTGIHQTIMQDIFNEILDYKYAHAYYDFFFVLNLPPKNVKFGDQNKTKYAVGRWEIEPIIEKYFFKEIKKSFPKTDMFKRIKKRIKEKNDNEEIQGLKKALRNKSKKVISDKYFPPSDRKGTLFIVEGECIEYKEKINIWRNDELLNIEMRELQIGDQVLTHNNRFKKIQNVQRKLKEVITIKTPGFSFKCSKKHPIYVLNTETNEFEFIKAKELDNTKHKIVKNLLRNFLGTVEIIGREEIDNDKYKIRFYLENDEVYDNTETHKYCIFDSESETFEMKESKDIQKGNLIALFEDI